MMSKNHCKRSWNGFKSFPSRIEPDRGFCIPSQLYMKSNDAGVFFGHITTAASDSYIGMPQGTDGNILIIGGNGSGKSSGIVIPTLKTWQGALCATDIKGELSSHYQQLYTRSRQKMRPSIIFDPSQPGGPSYDPFGWIIQDDESNLYRNFSDMARTLIPESPHDIQPFWCTSEQAVLTAGLMHYYRLGLSFSEALCAVLSSGLSKLCEEINASKNNLEKMILGSLSDLKAETLSNIDRGLRNKLLPLAADPHVSHAFRGSREGAPCFSWNDLEYSNIFLRIPPDKVKAWGSAINLMYTQLIRYLEQRPEKHSVQGAKNVQTLLVMDEFPQFGKLDLIVSAIPTLRSKSVNLCLVAQSIAQLDMLYGEYGRRIIFDNSQFQLILRANDADTQDLLCRLTGSTTVLQESVQKSLDPSGGSIGYSKQRTQIREPRIFPHQFSTLTDLLLLSPYGTCLLKKHQPHSEPVRISQNFDSGITVSSTNISNEGFLRMLTIKERTQAATKRAEAAQHTQRVHERNERNRTNKECARRNFIIGELVVSTFPELSKIIPGTAEENAARFRPLKEFLTQLAASPDLIDAIRKRAALPCSSGEITNPVQMGHDV